MSYHGEKFSSGLTPQVFQGLAFVNAQANAQANVADVIALVTGERSISGYVSWKSTPTTRSWGRIWIPGVHGFLSLDHGCPPRDSVSRVQSAAARGVRPRSLPWGATRTPARQ